MAVVEPEEFQRVHDVVIQGNTKTKDSVIEAEIGSLRDATTLQELFQAATCVRSRLHSLQIFDPGPPELPGTANVVVHVSELTKQPVPNKSSSMKVNNLFGYGDLWAGSIGYGRDQSEMSMGVYLPSRLRWYSPMGARDWQQLSSFKERSLGASLNILSSKNHDLSFNIAWRTLMDPSKTASSSIRRQLGHNLLSSLKYSFKNDRRDSSVRPTSGYCFASTTQLGLKFLRQDFDVRYAVPLGGLIFPWGLEKKTTSVSDRCFMGGGNSSPVRTLGGPSSLFGFQSRGVGPTDLRRRTMTTTAGDVLAAILVSPPLLTCPSKLLRHAGIYGHVFASAGCLTQLTDNKYRHFSLSDFYQSFRTSVGLGITVPSKLFTMEANLCYILKQHEHDNGKSGLEFSFSPPS
ncbi:LOW QUALITY PROTEIN: hypothetical protein V2J09_022680 [Rumex salicifolius]